MFVGKGETNVRCCCSCGHLLLFGLWRDGIVVYFTEDMIDTDCLLGVAIGSLGRFIDLNVTMLRFDVDIDLHGRFVMQTKVDSKVEIKGEFVEFCFDVKMQCLS